MDIKYKQSVKKLPVDDFIVELKRDEILLAAKKSGFDFGDKLSKKALVERLARMYDLFPLKVKDALSSRAVDAAVFMAQNDYEAPFDMEGVDELRQMGIAMVLDGINDDGEKIHLAVMPEKLAKSFL